MIKSIFMEKYALLLIYKYINKLYYPTTRIIVVILELISVPSTNSLEGMHLSNDRLILPVVVCLSQRLSHACLSMN
jgi:hypothetical protein